MSLHNPTNWSMRPVLARRPRHGLDVPFQKPYAFPPKPRRRLLERKRMTIALGILASDGIVVAADRLESYGGQFKLDQSKILPVSTVYPDDVNPELIGACLISGAGDAGHIDALTEQLAKDFCNHEETVLRVQMKAQF